MISTLWYTFNMEKREFYYVSRKSVMTWISVVLMLCSAVARIVLYWGRGPVSGTVMWFQILLPVVASILFILIVLFGGERFFYKSAIPIWLFVLCFAQMATNFLPFKRFVLLVWVLYATLAIFYTLVTAGRVRHFWLLWFVTAGLLAFFLAEKRNLILSAHTLREWVWVTHNAMMAASLFAISLAIQVRPDGSAYCPTWGDRYDGRRVRSVPAMSYMIPYIMPNRTAASNFIHDSFELTAIERYVRRKRLEGLSGFGIMHVFLSAYARIVAQYPAVNRFCSGQHIYSRDRDIEFVMTVKIKMTTDAPDTMINVHFDPADTPEDIYHKLNKEIDAVKDGPLDSDFDKTAKLLTYIPGLLLKFVVWMLKTLDYFGLLPPFLLRVSPFHGSVILTSMGSLGIPPIVHHLYDFGNLPVFLALGRKRKETVVEPDGKVVVRKFADFTVNTDERICDGFYFATALKTMKKYLANPERLDDPVEVIPDVY